MSPDSLGRLSDELDKQARETQKWMRYYEGRQPLSYLNAEIQRELDDRIRSVVINWPELVVDSLEERLDVEGFRLPGADRGDSTLWGWWQANDLDVESPMAHVEALACARAFIIVGTGDRNPIITVETSEQVTVDVDPRTRLVTAAIKRWCEDETHYAALYLPNSTQTFTRQGTHGAWVAEGDADEHGMGMVPVVPLVNRRRPMSPLGRSELESIVPLSDAACKMATDMMVGAEFHALPRRWAVGVDDADFQDTEGRPLSKWSKVIGRIWTAADPLTKMGEFPAAELSNFHNSINSLASLVASVSGIPPHYLGMVADNPASADAIRSAETRLVKRAERRQRAFGGAWEQVMRLAYRVSKGDIPEDLYRLETMWRDASTPTVAQKADAAVKLFQAEVVTKRQTREDLGYSDPQIKNMEADDAKAVDRLLAGDLSTLVGPKPPPSPTPQT